MAVAKARMTRVLTVARRVSDAEFYLSFVGPQRLLFKNLCRRIVTTVCSKKIADIADYETITPDCFFLLTMQFVQSSNPPSTQKIHRRYPDWFTLKAARRVVKRNRSASLRNDPHTADNGCRTTIQLLLHRSISA
jgi:hypothetical protein